MHGVCSGRDVQDEIIKIERTYLFIYLFGTCGVLDVLWTLGIVFLFRVQHLQSRKPESATVLHKIYFDFFKCAGAWSKMKHFFFSATCRSSSCALCNLSKAQSWECCVLIALTFVIALNMPHAVTDWWFLMKLHQSYAKILFQQPGSIATTLRLLSNMHKHDSGFFSWSVTVEGWPPKLNFVLFRFLAFYRLLLIRSVDVLHICQHCSKRKSMWKKKLLSRG